jgi:heme/copper-type cytochrome/quinol oxidase subunit 3
MGDIIKKTDLIRSNDYIRQEVVKHFPTSCLKIEIYSKNIYELNKLFFNKKVVFSPLTFHINLFDKGALINPYRLPLLNTVLLLSSGAFLTLSHKFLRLDRFLYSLNFLIVTIFLALAFIGCQVYEYTYSDFSINDGIYGSLFYMLTGFHGFHVIIGTVFLIVCLVRLFLTHYTRTDHLSFECAI